MPTGARAGLAGDTVPELRQGLPRPVPTATAPTRRERHGVAGAGRGATDRGDLQPFVLEQPIEHAPGEGTVRAATLQGETECETARSRGFVTKQLSERQHRLPRSGGERVG